MAYFTDDSLLPENMAPLMITAAPYGPMWMPQDGPPGYIPLTWDEQVQAAVDCLQRRRDAVAHPRARSQRRDTSRRTSRNTASRSGASARPFQR